MNWFTNLFTSNSIAHSVIIIALVITIGIFLGRIKVKGISLGITWILFAGIAFSHFGLTIDAHLLHFIKEFGLILFVYSVGLQVGPSFFSSFKKGGVSLNIIAVLIVLVGCLTAYIIHLVTGTSLITMIGILSGAVTNTPGLGAAQQTYTDVVGGDDATIALGYAVAYPLGVVGIIFSIIFVKLLYRGETEKTTVKSSNELNKEARKYSVVVKNKAITGKTIEELHKLLDKDFIVSRIMHSSGKAETPTSATIINEGDHLLITMHRLNKEAIATYIGELLDADHVNWENTDDQFAIKKVMVTNHHVNGKSLADLNIRRNYGVNVTRITRAGIDLVASGDLELQIGDRILVVGNDNDIEKMAKAVGNSTKELNEPNLVGIFLGIAVGVLFGSIPFMIPGIPQPVKLGLAGGPLIIAILISRFGYKFKIVTYTTQSANLMIREIGISLFLAAVGLAAGGEFVDTIVNKGGYLWVGYGVIITILPIIVGALVARYVYNIGYYSLMGLIAGSTTDPPALAYSNATAPNNHPSVSYATVYPLVMFMRVLTAQVLMLFVL